MDRNPYDTSIDWLQQSPANKQESRYTVRQPGSPQPQTPNAPKKVAPAKQPRMPKQKALELVSSLKKGIVVSSVMSFGLISLLATGHVVGTTTSTTTTKTPITSSNSAATATPSTASTATATATPSKTSTATATPSKASTSSSSSSSSASFGTSSSQSSVSGTSVS